MYHGPLTAAQARNAALARRFRLSGNRSAASRARLQHARRGRNYASTRPHTGLASSISARPPNIIGPNSQFGLPESMKVKFRYHGDSDAPNTLNADGVSRVTWRITNPTDPNQTGLGHQPMLWDQFIPLYKWCSVYGCKVEYQIYPVDTGTTTAPGVIGFASRSYDSNVGEVQVYRDEWERPDSVNGMVYSGGSNPTNITKVYTDCAKLAGKTKQEYLACEQYWVALQTTTYNPPREMWHTIIMKNLGATAIKYRLSVTLTYYAYVFSKNHVNPSLGEGPDHGVPDLEPEVL